MLRYTIVRAWFQERQECRLNGVCETYRGWKGRPGAKSSCLRRRHRCQRRGSRRQSLLISISTYSCVPRATVLKRLTSSARGRNLLLPREGIDGARTCLNRTIRLKEGGGRGLGYQPLFPRARTLTVRIRQLRFCSSRYSSWSLLILQPDGQLATCHGKVG